MRRWLESVEARLSVDNDRRTGDGDSVQEREVVRSDVRSRGLDQEQEVGTVEDGVVVDALVHLTGGHEAGPGVVTGPDERHAGGVELSDKDAVQVLGLGDIGSQDGLVHVVVRNVHARHVVADFKLSDVGGGESGPVGRDGRRNSFGSKVGVVEHLEKLRRLRCGT